MNKQVKLTDYDSLQQCMDVNNHVEQLEIVVPAGTYLTGPLDLRSNLTITLAKGAVIKFKDDPRASIRQCVHGGKALNATPCIP